MLRLWADREWACRYFTADTVPAGADGKARVAVGETVILLHPPLPSVDVSIGTERERQQNDSVADGKARAGEILLSGANIATGYYKVS